MEEELIKKAKEKYKEQQRRAKLDKRNAYRRVWYRQNLERCREYSREMGRMYYYKKKDETNKNEGEN
jgi:hypothetical protein